MLEVGCRTFIYWRAFHVFEFQFFTCGIKHKIRVNASLIPKDEFAKPERKKEKNWKIPWLAALKKKKPLKIIAPLVLHPCLEPFPFIFIFPYPIHTLVPYALSRACIQRLKFTVKVPKSSSTMPRYFHRSLKLTTMSYLVSRIIIWAQTYKTSSLFHPRKGSSFPDGKEKDEEIIRKYISLHDVNKSLLTVTPWRDQPDSQAFPSRM